MLIAMPLALLALAVSGASFSELTPEGVRAAPSALHSALSQPSAWRLPEPEVLRTHLLKPNPSAVRVGPHRVGRQSAATRIGAGFIGALLGLYVGGTLGAAMGAADKNQDALAWAVVGGYAGAAAGAIAGVLLVR
jgi:hypothetical protein